MFHPKSKLGVYCYLFSFISIFLIIWGAISFGFYCWYIKHYDLLDGGDRPVITGFGADVKKEDYLFKPSLYFCRPYYNVEFEYKGKKYYDRKSYDYYTEYDYSYLHWNNVTEHECIQSFVNKDPANRNIGGKLNGRYVTIGNPSKGKTLCQCNKYNNFGKNRFCKHCNDEYTSSSFTVVCIVVGCFLFIPSLIFLIVITIYFYDKNMKKIAQENERLVVVRPYV